MTRRKTSKRPLGSSNRVPVPLPQSSYEGDHLAHLLKSISREIELARSLDGALPEKFWFKQQFSIGVNEVTRMLERMTPSAEVGSFSNQLPVNCINNKASLVELQAILLASDCNPKWLTKHLHSLAASRNVPLILVNDKKAGSLRLGELVKIKSAIAIGIKAKGNAINQVIEETLRVDNVDSEVDRLKSSEMARLPS